MFEARKISFEEAWEKTTPFLINEDIENEIDNKVELVAKDSVNGRISQKPIEVDKVTTYLREKDEGVEAILAELTLSQEKFIRIVSLLRRIVIIMVSYQETTSSGQTNKARDMFRCYERVRERNSRYHEKRVFINFDFRPKRVKRIMIPTVLMILTYEVKQLVGISSMNQLEEHLFRDTALLKIIGFTARQIQEGFCCRGRGKRQGPMHRDTLADLLSKFSSKEVDFILKEAVRVLVKHRLIRGRTYILDATDLPTTECYKGCGMKKVIKKVWSKEGQEVETVKYIYGYKLLVLLEAKHKMVVAARVVKINEHEKNVTKELVREAQQRAGGAVKVLLVDRGFIDGVLLWWLWKKMRIRFVIPARSNMEVSQDIRGFRSEKADGQGVFVEQTKKMKVMGVKGLLSYDPFGEEEHWRRKGRKDFKANPINAVMVLRWDAKDYEPGKEKVFLTNFSVSRPMKIIEQYDLRSEIENQGFRELKQGYHLLQYPQKTAAAVRAHAVLTLIIYSLVNAYKSEQGQRLAHLGIRRWRRKQMGQSIHKMIVYYEGIYGIVDVEELFYLMDMTPKELYRLKIKQLQREIE